MKFQIPRAKSSTALLRRRARVSALSLKSLCCIAAGIKHALPDATKPRPPHVRLRRAAKPGVALRARNRPPAQLAQGYGRSSDEPQAKPVSHRYMLTFGWRSITPVDWEAAHLCNETILADMAQTWLLPDNVHHLMSVLDRRRSE